MIRLMALSGLLLSGAGMLYMTNQQTNTAINLHKVAKESLNNLNACRAQLERIEGSKEWDELVQGKRNSENGWLVFSWTNWPEILKRRSLIETSCDEQANMKEKAFEKAKKTAQRTQFWINVGLTAFSMSVAIATHELFSRFWIAVPFIEGMEAFFAPRA